MKQSTVCEQKQLDPGWDLSIFKHIKYYKITLNKNPANRKFSLTALTALRKIKQKDV